MGLTRRRWSGRPKGVTPSDPPSPSLPLDTTVSAVIPTCDRRDDLRLCLDSLEALDLPQLEIVVVDNGSTDGTAAMLEARPAVRTLHNARNRGASQAKNQGAAAATGEVLWFLDSDTVIPDTGVVPRAVEMLAGDPTVGAVGGEIYPRADGSREWRHKVMLRNAETRTVSSRNGYGGVLEVDYLPSCNLFIRAALFHELGGFDPDYFFLMEDTDLCHRLRSRGYRCLASDATAVEHRLVLTDRRGDLHISHRNRVRFVVLNYPLWRVTTLPVLDLAYTASPYKIGALWGEEISAVKHLSPAVRRLRGGKRGFPFKLAAAGSEYLVALARGYAWNARRLRRTLRQRREIRRHDR